MKHKKQIIEFLNDNHCMINSLMSTQERKTFGGDVVSLIKKEIQMQIDKENGLKVSEDKEMVVE